KRVWYGMCLLYLSSFLPTSCKSSGAAGSSCEKLCGADLKTCSCHPACEPHQTCCTDYRQFCVDTEPHSGTMFGGTDFVVSSTTFDPDSKLLCRFSGEVQTKGYVDRDGTGHCISPLLYETGWIPFEVSTDDGVTYSMQGTWVSVFPGWVDPGLKVTLVNLTQWQYYGTPNVAGALRMMWNTFHMRADQVNVELWGYRETGEPYSDSWLPEWNFIPQSAEKTLSTWHLGSVRVCPSSNPDDTWNVNALWSDLHALAWHLEGAFRQDSAAWALERCLDWDRLERRLGSFLNETIDCPCTLAQALADTARFHRDYGCDIMTGSVCTYHPGCVHCIRAIQASLKYGAGQQCCYDSAGDLVLTGDSVGGSTPDRGHVWGSPPYRRPPRVPGLSHWLYDVISFYYCCLWSDSCHYYFTHRPSSDCRSYKVPMAGVVFGNLHFITFNGTEYTLNGEGEFYLVCSDKGLTVQGRTEPVKLENGTLKKATRLAALAMKENTSDVIEVRFSSQQTHLEVLRNQQVLSFLQRGWVDLKGERLWVIANGSSLFTYNSESLWNAARHPALGSALSTLEDPEDPLYPEVSELCVGEGSRLCSHDALAAQSIEMGRASQASFQAHMALVKDLEPVLSCGWLPPPSNGQKEGRKYLLRATVRFSCNKGYVLSGSSDRTCENTGRWSGDATHCVSGMHSVSCSLFAVLM
uniref:Sushi domain-containing protein 2-like n=1 Tax=Scleropages formosus TaxID=113540 RepID=A0A8C9TVA5_SCLFO